MLEGPRMRFQLDREVLGQLYTFGRWIFVSTMLTFACSQLDRIVLGKALTMSELGVYSIAFMLSQVMVHVVCDISGTVLFPVYARSAEIGREALRRQTLRFRGVLLLLTLPPMWVLIWIAPELIEFLYDDRYREAGWMLQVLTVAALIQCVLAPVESVLLAHGDSFRHMCLEAVTVVSLIGSMLAGGYIWGTTGIIYGIVVASGLHYPVLAWMVRRYGVWFPMLDLAAALASALAIGGGLYLKVFWL